MLIVNHISFKKLYIALKGQDTFKIKMALLDNDKDQNCIKEILIPFPYYEGTKEQLLDINRSPLQTKYKISTSLIKNIVFKIHSNI